MIRLTSARAELPEGWALASIDSIIPYDGVFYDGDWVESKDQDPNGDVRLIQLADVGDGVFCNQSARFLTSRKAAELRCTYLRKGDILIARMPDPLGRACVFPLDGDQRFVTAVDVCIVRTDHEQVDRTYLCYVINYLGVREQIEDLQTGTTRKRISRKKLATVKIPLPPSNEQRRIAAKINELFSELDKGIESLQNVHDQLATYRQAVLKHAFEGKLTAHWRAENKDNLYTREQLLQRIEQERTARYERQLNEWKAAVETWEATNRTGRKPSKPKKPDDPPQLGTDELADLPPLPQEHAYTYFANLGELERGTSKHRPRNDPELFGGPYPFIQTGEVKAADRIIREYDRTYNELGLAQSRLWPKGTLCITIAANIAETALLGFDGCFPDSVVGFTATETLVLPRYVELFIKSVRTRIEAYAPATAQRNINLVVLESLVIPLCSLQEQRALLDRLEAIFSVINEQRREIEKHLHSADALRQSILRSAFTGQLVTQDATDEPASALLERIRAERDQIAKRETPRTNRKRKTTKVTT